MCKSGTKAVLVNKPEKYAKNITEKEANSVLMINVSDDIKTVEVWLTQEEKRNAALREQLKPLYQEYKEKKYLVAVFESGSQDIWKETGALLCYNRKRIAQMEEERVKHQGMAMTM